MNSFPIRIIKLIFGLLLYALGIVVTMRANLGFAPWEVFHQGISSTIGFSIGKVSILTGLVICIIVVFMGEKLGLGTVLNMLLIGIFMDMILQLGFIPAADGFLQGVLVMFAGLFIISIASYFYIGSGFGAGPRDSLMVSIERKTGLPVGLSRGIIEGTAVFTGWLLGGPVGFGTLIAALGISFCIQITFSMLDFNATLIKHEQLGTTLRNLKIR